MSSKTAFNFSDTIFEMAAGLSDQLPTSTVNEIVFSGRSNVGKSSLINSITNRKSLARTSSKPGKTGTINFYRAKSLRLVDLPGYGYAKVPFTEKKRWSGLVENYFGSGRRIKVVIQIIDMRHPPTEDDLQMLKFLSLKNMKFIIVLTKSDKLNKTNRLKRISCLQEELFEFSDIRKIIFSAVTKEGLDDIKEVILCD